MLENTLYSKASCSAVWVHTCFQKLGLKYNLKKVATLIKLATSFRRKIKNRNRVMLYA